MILFGWARRTVHDHGPVVYEKCPNCHNDVWFLLITIRRWFTLFFIPVIPYETQHRLLCPTCSRGVLLAGEELKKARRLNELAVRLNAGVISPEEYRRSLPEVEQARPSLVQSTSTTTPDPTEAQAAPTTQPTSPQVAPAPASPVIPTFQGARRSRLRILRLGLGFAVVVAIAIGFAFLRGGGGTAFQQGNCIVGAVTATEIRATSCSNSHDARIVKVESDSHDSCPAGDDEFIAEPPKPSLCLDYSDHSP